MHNNRRVLNHPRRTSSARHPEHTRIPASAAKTIWWRVDHERRTPLPTTTALSNLKKPFSPKVAPTVRNLKQPCCRQCHNPTPDFHNSLSTMNCATRPTPDIVHANRLDHVGEGRQQTLYHKASKTGSGDAKPRTLILNHHLQQPHLLIPQAVVVGAPPQA